MTDDAQSTVTPIRPGIVPQGAPPLINEALIDLLEAWLTKAREGKFVCGAVIGVNIDGDVGFELARSTTHPHALVGGLEDLKFLILSSINERAASHGR